MIWDRQVTCVTHTRNEYGRTTTCETMHDNIQTQCYTHTHTRTLTRTSGYTIMIWHLLMSLVIKPDGNGDDDGYQRDVEQQ